MTWGLWLGMWAAAIAFTALCIGVIYGSMALFGELAGGIIAIVIIALTMIIGAGLWVVDR